MEKVTKLFDCHSHWGTKRGYLFRTEAELAQQEKIWKTKATFWSEDEMADYFRQNNVRTILDLSFTKFLPIEEIRAHHDYAFEFQRKHPDVVFGHWLQFDPRELPVKGLIVHLGTDDRAALEALWGADVYDTYGCNECGTMAAECGHKSGMHVFEDAFILEVNDPETLQPKNEGERGVVFITTLFKYAAPMIRYNMNDVTSLASGDCACGCVHRRITKIFGRSDNMVKLRSHRRHCQRGYAHERRIRLRVGSSRRRA